MTYKTPENERAYKKRWYDANKEVYYERNKQRRLEKRKYVHDLKGSTPCADCGIQYHYCVMDFDHKEDEIKIDVINKLCNGGWKKLLDEIAKCEIVCSNCHRMRTFKRLFPDGVTGNTSDSGSEESTFDP